MSDECSVANRHFSGFTLLELMAVIVIVVVLAGFLFPAAHSVLEHARKVQAKNDLLQIETAVNAFYTEYGRYPTNVTGGDASYGPGFLSSKALFDELRAKSASLNTRQIVFISPTEDASQTNPKGKIGSDGQFHDPWGTSYSIKIDADYDNEVGNPYGGNGGGGPDPLRRGIISWSVGKDRTLGANGNNLFKDANGTQCDDVISWQ